MLSSNVILRSGYVPNPYDIVLYDGTISGLTLTGHVVMPSGTGVAGVTVLLFRTSDNAFIGSTVSDVVGFYSFTGLSATDYFVNAYLSGLPDLFGTSSDKEMPGDTGDIVILWPGYHIPFDVILRDGTLHPVNPIPVVSGGNSYLLLFPSLGSAVRDPVIAQYYNPSSSINVGCNPDVLVYDLVTGDIDPRWGIMITLPAPIVPALFFHPNLELLVNSPKSLASVSSVIENNLDRPATSYQFLVSGAGPFPFKWF